MILLGNILIAIGQIVQMILSFLTFVVIAGVVVQMLNADYYNPIVRFIYSITDPTFNFIRRKIRLQFGALDFAPFIVLIIIVFLQSVLGNSLVEYGASIKVNSAISRVTSFQE